MKKTGNTILVTGGGTGIGRALAHRWHDAGNHVIITGRRHEVLEAAIAGRERMTALPLDVTAKDDVEGFAGRILVEHPLLNVLVNNAGTYAGETIVAHRDLTAAQRMIDTNVTGPIRLTNALIDHLTIQADAAIINVSSGLAFVPLPAAPTYSATKAAIHAYTAAIRPMLKDRVEVIEIVPPQVQTELSPGQSTDPNGMPLDAFADEVFALLYDGREPVEVCVQGVLPFRRAEAEGRFDEMLEVLARYS